MKYVSESLAREYRSWLTSSDNPDYLGTEEYDRYDYYIDRLIEKAVELNLVNDADVNVEDLAWLNKLQGIFNSSVALKSLDKTVIGHGGASASLKKLIKFIQFKTNGGKSIMTEDERKAMFRKYMADCGRCNELAGKKDGPNANTLDNYWFGLSSRTLHDANIQPFAYDDDLTFEPVKKQIIQFDKGGDPSQGAKWYSKYLVECKFKKLLEWFVRQIKINNDLESGRKTQGKGANGDRIRKLYERWRAYVGFELDCTVRQGYQSAQSGSNYIHLTDTWLNIIPIFTQLNDKSDVRGLKIVYKPENKPEREYQPVNVQDLGLFDGDFPNEKLRKFFDDFKKEILAVQKELGLSSSAMSLNTNGGHKQRCEHELNLILYGPPGTGKTFHTIPRAMSIIDADCHGLKYWEEEYDKNKSAVLAKFNAELQKGSYDNNGRKIKTGHIAFVTFHQSYGYEEFIEGIKPKKTQNDTVIYEIIDGAFKDLCVRAEVDLKNHNTSDYEGKTDEEFKLNNNYVIIIDEINRGNVSKIFGELITLIEETKRLGNEEEMTTQLPYSGKDFGVPKNVYIIGTMNTADRSLVQLDAALRRRFAFEEMMPNPELLRGKVVDGIELDKLLEAINKRITALLDREHQIGHSYFMKVQNMDNLVYVFRQKIIPLLQEYFFDDYIMIGKVLGEKFIKSDDVYFGDEKKTIYSIPDKKDFPKDVEVYKAIYDSYSKMNTDNSENNESIS